MQAYSWEFVEAIAVQACKGIELVARRRVERMPLRSEWWINVTPKESCHSQMCLPVSLRIDGYKVGVKMISRSGASEIQLAISRGTYDANDGLSTNRCHTKRQVSSKVLQEYA